MSAGEPFITAPEAGAGPPLFILSFRQRDELAALAARAGWQAVAARRADSLQRRYSASGARVAVIDARGALGDGLAAAAALGEQATADGAALLVLVSRGDIGEIGTFFDAGATHFLASPHHEAEFVEALRFAQRYAERANSDWRRRPTGGATLGWRLTLADGRVRLTSALAALLDTDELMTPRALIARLDGEGRAQVLRALRRARRGGATAIALDLPGIGRVAQHIQFDVAQARADGLVERLIDAPQAQTIVADALSSVRDAATARRWLDQRLDNPGGGGVVQAALIALSRFDIVNTAYGRVAGDALLRAAQQRIDEIAADLLGVDAVAVRVAGAEFLLACDAPPARLELAAGRIAEALARPFVVGGAMVVVGCRIGLATAHGGETAADLLRRASEALALAKASDSVTVHVARDAAAAIPIDTLAVDLRQALDRREIGILFQPQVAIATGRIVGVEALARWEHPTLGALGAETLFAAAERAELAIALSDHIQRTVLAEAASWPAALSALRLSLNLTAADIARPGFADLFLDRVDASGFQRGRLTVEITESGLIEDLGIAARLLSELRSAGCRVAIDDFGTGYSSLAYLKALPLDYLKIDKKLAQDITGSARDRVVVRGVIDMARSLGLSVIAEGVETPEQLDLLAREGCQYYQGYLCSEPLTTAALIDLIGAELGRTQEG